MKAVRYFALCAVATCLGLAGCVSSEELANDATASPIETGFYASDGASHRFALARTDEAVRSIQLHRTGDESSLPIQTLNSNGTLTLSFDILDEGTGGPLSVYFYHADRTWTRDLVPSEYLRSFLSDDIRRYDPSSATEIRYVHYTYDFPNANIDFLTSGNYIIRVAEQGYEDEPLFERAFFVSEDAAEIEIAFRSGFSLGGSILQPVIQLRPGSRLEDVQAFDYAACFVRNGRVEQTRCAPEPSIIDLALMQFYLPRDQAFSTEEQLYELDLGRLQVGPQIANVDFSTSPYAAELDLDYARFGSEINRASLTGQPVIDEVYVDGGRAETEAEYVDVTFRYVPENEQQARGAVIVSGAFNNWQIDPENTLSWVPDAGRYEGTLLLKQGLYLYRYYVDDPAARPETNLSLQQNLYTALVYVFDPTRLTDRLVAFRSAVAQ